jgi:nucleoside-diphosphate-sugar epimerase
MDFGTDLILVTGALGWLGFSLVESLVKGLADSEGLICEAIKADQARLRCLILPNQDPTPLQNLSPAIEIITGDLRDRSTCNQLCANAKGAILFHTAGVIHPQKVIEFYQVNVEGTKNLIDAAIANKVKRAVIVSSNSPLGCNPHADHLFDENSPYHPYMNYGKSKMQMELAIKERQDLIETAIIRAPWFYGENQPPRQTLFFRMIRNGKAPIVGDGTNRRSMAYIGNLCQGLVLAALVPKAKGQIYWLADARAYTMNEIIDTVEKLLETEFNQVCKHGRLKLPGFASEIALFADATLQSLGVYQQKIHVLSEMNKTIACSIAKAQRDLGYQPKFDLERGMRASLQWLFSRNPQALD